MGCLFALLAGFFPRLAVLFVWLARPAFFNNAFGGSWLWPVLGILFLPFTTLMYTVLVTPGIGLIGLDWLWLGLALALDVSGFGGTGYVYRDRFGRRVS
jgi:hypothetical protein